MKPVPLPQNVNPLVRQLYVLINQDRAGLKNVSLSAGLSHNAVFNWRSYEPLLNNFEAALNVLGKKLAIVDVKSDDRGTDIKDQGERPKATRVMPRRHYVTDFEVRK